jgi:opacity protein-like surface antigen
MNRTLLTSALMLISGLTIAAEFTGNVSGLHGNKKLDNDDWGDFDSQSEFGVISDFKMTNWPVSIAVDAFISADSDDDVYNDNNDNIDIDAVTTELHVGVRKIWNISGTNLSPYIGGGLAYVNGYQETEINGNETDDDDSDIGTWIGTGIYWRPISHLNIGFDLRYSQAEVTINDQDLETGGLHTGVFAGYHW